MARFKSWEQFDETHRGNRPLILVGNLATRSHFVEKNRLNPTFEFDYDGLCESSGLLLGKACDILVSYITPFDICRVICFLEQIELNDDSFVYLYHKFDIDTGSYRDCCQKVYINGSLVIDGDYSFYRTGLNVELLTDDDFRLLKTAFNDKSLTKDRLLAIKNDNCQVTIREGRAIRMNSVNHSLTDQSNRYVYLLGGCVWSSNYSTHPNQIKQILQRILDTESPDTYIVEHISNVGSNEKTLISLRRAKLKPGGVVFIGNVDKPEVISAICRICEAQQCRAVAYLFPNILSRKHPSEYERRIIDRGWRNDLAELQEKLSYHHELLEELSFLGIEAYEPPIEFFESDKTLLLDFSGVHLGDKANEIIAGHLANIVSCKVKRQVGCKKSIEFTRAMISDIIPGINLFCAGLEMIGNKQRRSRCGAVVMACNPFTNGHKYLIEYASSRVDHLYVLVVQEDRFDFSFEERFMLVKRNTSDLENVTVLPGGEYVISNTTFGDYFSRVEKQKEETRPDAVLDLLIFACFIAPALNIGIRFVGTEPLCRVTRNYNEQMKTILPEYGCEVVEVPRLTSENKVISASSVRELIKTHRLTAIEPLVPKQTFDYLSEKYALCASDDCDGIFSE